MSSEISFTATLIARPGSSALTEEIALRCSAAIQADTFDWLSDNQALDLTTTANRHDVQKKLSNCIGEQPIDIALQLKTVERRKKILIADMDSTMI